MAYTDTHTQWEEVESKLIFSLGFNRAFISFRSINKQSTFFRLHWTKSKHTAINTNEEREKKHKTKL